jgi:hypothetical protein
MLRHLNSRDFSVDNLVTDACTNIVMKISNSSDKRYK